MSGSSRLLLTAFEPFGGERVNPSWELARAVAPEAARMPSLSLAIERLPVQRDALLPALNAAMEQHRPGMVLALGQATGRDRICLEALAVNRLVYGEARDNAGRCGLDEPLRAGGPDRLASTLPVEWLARELTARDHPLELSRDAGRFLCNALLYHLLQRWPEVPAAFLHLPLLPEQARRRARHEASLPQRVTRACLLDLLRLLSRADAGPAPGVA